MLIQPFKKRLQMYNIDFNFTIETENIFPTISTTPEIIKPTEIIEVEAEVIPNSTNFLGWEVNERPIYNKEGRKIDGYKELVRSDNHLSLNVCKDGYTHTPNALFCESVDFLQNLTGLKLEKVEELKSGKILLAYLWNSEPINICGHNYNTYMIIGNSHNYESTFFIGEHSTMMRCQNQFNRVGKNLKAWHTSGHTDQVKRLLTYYQHFKALQQNTIQLMQHFETISVNEKLKNNLIKCLLDIKPGDELKQQSTRKKNIIQKLEASINMEMHALGQNAFGLFNGVTHWTTHERNEKDKIYSRFFGSSAALNNKALKYLHETE